jgi:hypothetical protein
MARFQTILCLPMDLRMSGKGPTLHAPLRPETFYDVNLLLADFTLKMERSDQTRHVMSSMSGHFSPPLVFAAHRVLVRVPDLASHEYGHHFI